MATDTEAPGTPGKAYADKDEEHAIEEVHGVVKRLLDEGRFEEAFAKISRLISADNAVAESFTNWYTTISPFLHTRGTPRLSGESPAQSVSQRLVDTAPARRIDPLLERMQRSAAEKILTGTAWLSARDVGMHANPDSRNIHAFASRLLKQRRVFAIERLGRQEFPQYAFDALGQPLPAVAEVIQILDGYTPLRLASWFESASAILDGKRPRELLASDPQAVVRAARAHLAGAAHG